MTDLQAEPLADDYERAQMFPNGKELQVTVPHIEGIASYVLALCEVVGASDGETHLVAEEIFVRPDPDLLPTMGHIWRHLDPAKEWTVYVMPQLPNPQL